MKIHAQPKPLHEPLSGGTQGATVTVEPLIGGHVHWPLELMERPGGRFESLKLMRKLLAGDGLHRPLPGLPDPPPERRRDPRGHRASSLDHLGPEGELRRARRPLQQARAGAGRGRPRPAAAARDRPGPGADRGDDAPALSTMPRRSRSSPSPPSSSARPSGSRRRRTAARRCAATGRRTMTSPSTTAPSTSPAATSTATPPSAAPSTCSATARSGSPTRPGTAPGTRA